MRLNQILKTVWKEFIYGGHLQCLGVAGIAYTSSFILNLDISWKFLVLSYLVFYPIYVHDRFRGIKMDKATNPERTDHFEKYLSIMPKLILGSIILLLILLIQIENSKLFIFSLVMLFLGLLYPLYFKGLTKKIIAFKNFYVSAFFAAMVAIPVVFHGYELDLSTTLILAILMVFVFIKTMLMQILLDCKDIEGDKPLGLLTIPVLIGKDRSLKLLKSLSLLAGLAILIPIAIILPQFLIGMIALLLVIPVNLYSYILSQRNNYMGYVIGSSEFVLWFALIFTTKLII